MCCSTWETATTAECLHAGQEDPGGLPPADSVRAAGMTRLLQVPTSELKHQPSALAANAPQKRKRTSVASPSETPQGVNSFPTPEPFTSADDMLSLLNLVPRPSATISPADLPVCSDVAPSPQPSTAPLCDDGPLMIHNRPVEEYQRIYHKVVDDMLRYNDGRLRPYSLALGRRSLCQQPAAAASTCRQLKPNLHLWSSMAQSPCTASILADSCGHSSIYGL
ncbi:uncharacterized protein LOC125891766 [Epinephelus fuscoguttatus]|uniref:uncharacterized protein LOC125891766 n=1 Tax=Epinephelus fuscoguttatus TaxID=293821 RepID=UPI0020D10CB7|nr:uncharacterized protein LOC125891766 [Epinephelus fuscoguttatus]